MLYLNDANGQAREEGRNERGREFPTEMGYDAGLSPILDTNGFLRSSCI